MPLRFRDKFLIKFCSTSQRPRTPKPFKTLMMSFKIQLSLNTTLDAINDASMIDFGPQNGHKIVPKALPNWFEGVLKEALVEDNTWKVKKSAFHQKKDRQTGATAAGRDCLLVRIYLGLIIWSW